MDPLQGAVAVSAIAGAILGTLGYLQSRKKDTRAARTTAADVAEAAVGTAVDALESAIAYLRNEVRELRERVDRCETEKRELRAELAELRRGA